MALIACQECGNQISTEAMTCPKCGGPLKTRLSARNIGTPAPIHRKISIALIIGIALLPYIFAWLLLRRGYSRESRTLGLGWMAFILLVVGFGRIMAHETGGAKPTAGVKVDIDPLRAEKDLAAAVARRVVPTQLKDPASAKFGRVWGMSATVACGYINAKNSFGAMAGQARFILNDGRIAFENNKGAFARRWNATCVDKPHSPAPTGAGGIRWGSRPPATLKQYAPATNGLAVYVPRTRAEPLEGVAVAEADYEFDHDRLFSADFYIDGEAGRDATLAAYVKKYGTPQSYDESAGSYKWKWLGSHISVSITYEASHGRTTVNINHD